MKRHALRIAPLALALLAGCSPSTEGSGAQPAGEAPAPAAQPTPAPKVKPDTLGTTLTVTLVRPNEDSPNMREIWLTLGETKIYPERKDGPLIYHFDGLGLEPYTLELVDTDGVRRTFPDQFAGVPLEVELKRSDWSAFDLPAEGEADTIKKTDDG